MSKSGQPGVVAIIQADGTPSTTYELKLRSNSQLTEISINNDGLLMSDTQLYMGIQSDSGSFKLSHFDMSTVGTILQSVGLVSQYEGKAYSLTFGMDANTLIAGGYYKTGASG